LIVPLFPLPENLAKELYQKEQYHRQIREVAGEKPVVFTNSYQDASLQWFFSGVPSFSQNNKYYRLNHYDLMGMEEALQGQQVLYFPKPPFPGCDSLETVFGRVYYHQTEYFCRFNRLRIELPDREWTFSPGEEVLVDLTLINPTQKEVCFCDSCTHDPILLYTFFASDGSQRGFKARYQEPLPTLAPGEILHYPVGITIPEDILIPGEEEVYTLIFSFGDWNNPAGINSRPVRMKIHARSTPS
jgi:hypothetical protein